MLYLFIGGGLILVYIVYSFMNIRKEVIKREPHQEPKEIHEIADQLSKRSKLYIMDGLTKLASDPMGNLDRSGFNASLEIAELLGITGAEMKKYKYLSLTENVMAKTLFLLKKWQRNYMMTCFAYVYQNLGAQTSKDQELLRRKSRVLQMDTDSLLNDLSTEKCKSFKEIYTLVLKNSNNTNW